MVSDVLIALSVIYPDWRFQRKPIVASVITFLDQSVSVSELVCL